MKNLNGYRASHRNKWVFVQNNILTIQELSLLEFYADIFCFDRNKQDFGLFEVNFDELKSIFHCKSENTVRNWHKKLLTTGFIKKTNKRTIYQLTCWERYIVPSAIWKGKASYYTELEKNQPIEKILQNFGITSHSIGENSQPVANNISDLATNHTAIAISSSKDEVSMVGLNKKVVIKQEPRSESEYQKIQQEGNFPTMTIEDMRWIDENAKEEITIENDEMEKEIVKTYFNGDWNNYQRNVIQ